MQTNTELQQQTYRYKNGAKCWTFFELVPTALLVQQTDLDICSLSCWWEKNAHKKVYECVKQLNTGTRALQAARSKQNKETVMVQSRFNEAYKGEAPVLDTQTLHTQHQLNMWLFTS